MMAIYNKHVVVTSLRAFARECFKATSWTWDQVLPPQIVCRCSWIWQQMPRDERWPCCQAEACAHSRQPFGWHLPWALHHSWAAKDQYSLLYTVGLVRLCLFCMVACVSRCGCPWQCKQHSGSYRPNERQETESSYPNLQAKLWALTLE